MQSETHRKIIGWYIRFDIFASLMSGYDTALGREWHLACTEFYVRQSKDRPTDLGSLFEEKFAASRLVATDIASLFGKKAKGVMGDQEFKTEIHDMRVRIMTMRDALTHAFEDTRTFVKEFPGAPADTTDLVFNSTDPNFIFAGELFTWNFILIDFWGIYLIFVSQVAQLEKDNSGEEFATIAFTICKMFEALQYATSDSDSIILGAQASLGVAAIGLPKDQRHTMWCRSKYARIESCG